MAQSWEPPQYWKMTPRTWLRFISNSIRTYIGKIHLNWRNGFPRSIYQWWCSPYHKYPSHPSAALARTWRVLASVTEERNFHLRWSWQSCQALQSLLGVTFPLHSLLMTSFLRGSWVSVSWGELPKLLEGERRGEYLRQVKMNQLRWACQNLAREEWWMVITRVGLISDVRPIPESSERLLCSSNDWSLSSRLVPTRGSPLMSLLLGTRRGVEEYFGWPRRK